MATLKQLAELYDYFVPLQNLIHEEHKYLHARGWEHDEDGNEDGECKWRRKDGEVFTQEQALNEEKRVDQMRLLNSIALLTSEEKSTT